MNTPANVALLFGRSTGIAVIAAVLSLCRPPPCHAHGDLDDRIAEVSAALERAPSDPELLVERGDLYCLHHEWDSALRDYVKAEALLPVGEGIDGRIGRALAGTGKNEPAVKRINRQLDRDGDNAALLLDRARVLCALRRGREAEADYRRVAQRADRAGPDFYVEWARCSAMDPSGGVDRAVGVLDEGIRRLGPLVTLVGEATRLEAGSGRPDAALARIAKLADADGPRSIPWKVMRADLLKDAGRGAAARAAYRAALEQIDRLGPNARRTGQSAGMRRHVSAALKSLDPAGGR